MELRSDEYVDVCKSEHKLMQHLHLLNLTRSLYEGFLMIISGIYRHHRPAAAPCSVHCIRIFGYGGGMSLFGLGGQHVCKNTYTDMRRFPGMFVVAVCMSHGHFSVLDQTGFLTRPPRLIPNMWTT